jgi:Na+/melibiose symporter-like transporter
LLCSLYSYFIGDVFGIIMAILIVGWLLFFKEEKQEEGK